MTKSIFIAISILFIVSCIPNNPVINPSSITDFYSYRIKTIKTYGDNLVTLTDSFFYNADSLLDHINTLSPNGTSGIGKHYTYSVNRIDLIGSNANETEYYELINGLASFYYFEFIGSGYQSKDWRYNQAKYITQNSVFDFDLYTPLDSFYYDGNNNNVKIHSYVYYPSVGYNHSDTNFTVINTFDLTHFNSIQNINKGMKFLGKESDNVVIKTSVFSGSNQTNLRYTIDYTYEFDSKNRIIKRMSRTTTGIYVVQKTEEFTYY